MVFRRSLLVAGTSLLALLAAAAPAAAVEPIDTVRDPKPTAPPPVEVEAAQPSPSPSPTATPAPSPEPTGYDVSYPQCGRTLPEVFGFAIVGVNGGRVYSANPCLVAGEHASELAWAGQGVQLYANTGNPGPELSSFWPHGATEPRHCNTAERPGADTIDCAYVYGWNAAADSYRIAREAFAALGWIETDAQRLPEGTSWWLDVEAANSWRDDHALNVAALQGAVDYLTSMDAGQVGFYSTPRLWDRITGGTDAFADLPSWHAGATDLADAQRRCSEEQAFTGGKLAMVQWVENDLDANYRCP